MPALSKHPNTIAVRANLHRLHRLRPPKSLTVSCRLILLLCSVAGVSFGQSTDINFPSPVRTNEVVGSIAARDIGDARRTDHFYTFVGNPGDIFITVQSNNLNGDIDVFTAGSLRPLMKFTLYAESTTPITKSVYLRRQQDLVLRVEARSPNDDEGTYQLRFGGSFQPIAGEALLAADESPSPEPSPEPTRGTKRVTSAGARIPEPPRPVEDVATAAPTPEPTPEATPEAKPVESPSPTAAPERAAETEARAPAPRRGRGRTPAGRRAARPSTTTDEPAAKDTKTEEPTTATETKTETATPARRTGRRGVTKQAEPPQEPEPLTGPRLIIEMLDGTRIERYMSTLKRVTVENNQIVVVNKLGRIERVRLSDVTRMSIEP